MTHLFRAFIWFSALLGTHSAWAIYCPEVGLHTVGPHGRYSSINSALTGIGECIRHTNIIFVEQGFRTESVALNLDAGDLTIAGGWSPSASSRDPNATLWWASSAARALTVNLSGQAAFTLRDISVLGGTHDREGAGIYINLDNVSRVSVINSIIRNNMVNYLGVSTPGSLGRGSGLSAHVRQAARLSLDGVTFSSNMIAAMDSARGAGLSVVSYSPYTSVSLQRLIVEGNIASASEAAIGDCRGAGVDIEVDDASPPFLARSGDEYFEAGTLRPVQIIDNQRISVSASTFFANRCYGWSWADGTGLSVSVSGEGNVISNRYTQLSGYLGANVLLEGNSFIGNKATAARSVDDAQLLLSTTRHKDRILARNNLLWGQGDSNAGVKLNHQGVYVGDSVLVNQSVMQFVGNTLTGHLGVPIHITGLVTPLRDMRTLFLVRNNLISLVSRKGDPADYTIQNALRNTVFFSPELLDIFPVIDTTSNCILANPLFVDASVGDFRLQGTSPAINAGWGGPIDVIGSTDRSGRSRWRGTAPDCGAYEFQ